MLKNKMSAEMIETQPFFRSRIEKFFLLICVTVLGYVATEIIMSKDFSEPLSVSQTLIPLKAQRIMIPESRTLTGQEKLNCLTNGAWAPDPSLKGSSMEKRLDSFFRKTRDLYHLPNPLQREDNKCGSVTFGGKLHYFRAVCDPFESTPCCYEGKCTSVTVDQCSCANCLHLNSTFHGELATWQGRQNDCQLKNFTQEEACEALKGRTIVFIGDSFMRQMFMATQILLTGNDVDSCMKRKMTPARRAHCKWMAMFTRECRFYVPEKDVLCHNTVTIRLVEFYSTSKKDLSRVIESYRSLSKLTVVVGVGLHFSFSSKSAINNIGNPVLNAIRPGPGGVRRVLWMLPHSLGLLKTPELKNQLNPSLLRFSENMKQYLEDRGVFYIDAFNLTKNLASYDGVHYPKAANVIKVQVLLNHLTGDIFDSV